jgi:hypothetical protein
MDMTAVTGWVYRGVWRGAKRGLKEHIVLIITSIGGMQEKSVLTLGVSDACVC